jgi:hypothetical protein
MKKLLFLAAILAVLFAATLAFAEDKKDETGTATVSVGQISVDGSFKAGLNYYVGNQELNVGTPTTGTTTVNGKKVPTYTQILQPEQRDQNLEFAVNYFRLGFKGWIIDKRVTYDLNMIAGEVNPIYASGAKPVDKNGNALTGTISTITPNDMRLGFHYIPYVSIYFGRMLPAFTYFDSVPTEYYKTIEQPLIDQNIVHRDRETGVNFALNTIYLAANLGIYNGRQYFPVYEDMWGYMPKGANNPMGNVATIWGDENTGKDIHFGVIGKPLVALGKEHMDDLRIRASLWYGLPLDGFKKNANNSLTEHDTKVTFIDADIDYLGPNGWTVIGEIFYGQYVWDKRDASANFGPLRMGPWTGVADSTANTLTTMSYNLMAGYNFGPVFQVPIELLARYDWWDPDTLNNAAKRPTSVNDQLTDITGCFNYYIKYYNAMIRLDYIHHMQQWKSYSGAAADGTQYNIEMLNLAGTAKSTGIRNDALKFEAQVSF